MRWGDTDIVFDQPGYALERDRSIKQKKLQESINCLFEIADAVPEIIDIAYSRVVDFEGNILQIDEKNLFVGKPIKVIPSPIDPSSIAILSFGEKNGFKTWFDRWTAFLKELTPSDVTSENFLENIKSAYHERAKRMSKEERQAFLRNLEHDINGYRDFCRFHQLYKSLPKKQFLDAFHFWTAERGGCKYFLSTDFRFIRKLRGLDFLKSNFECKPVTPPELLDELGIDKPLDYGELGQTYLPLYEVLGKSKSSEEVIIELRKQAGRQKKNYSRIQLLIALFFRLRAKIKKITLPPCNW